MERRRSPRRGELWRVATPNMPDDPHQPRSALVISSNVLNHNNDRFLVVPVFSEGAIGPTHVLLGAGLGGIRHDSVLFCEEVFNLDGNLFADDSAIGGLVPPEILRDVVRGIRVAIGDVVADE